MPRKKNVVNETINLAPQEQDLSVNEKVEIEKKVKLVRKPINKKKKNQTGELIESENKAIIIERKLEPILNTLNEVPSNFEQIEKKDNATEIIDKPNNKNKSKVKKKTVNRIIEVVEDEEVVEVIPQLESPIEKQVESTKTEFVEPVVIKKKPKKKKKKVIPKAVSDETILTQSNNETEIKTEVISPDEGVSPKTEQSEQKINESKEFMDDLMNKLNLKDEVRKLETEITQKNDDQTEVKVDEKSSKKKSKWQKKKKEKAASFKGETKTEDNAQKVEKEVGEGTADKEVVAQIEQKIETEISPISDIIEVKKEEVTKVQEEIKQEVKKKNKNKKKKKNKKDKVDNDGEGNNDAPDQIIQQSDKKKEPPKVVRKPDPEIIITINPKKMLTKEQEKNPFLMKFFTQLEDFLRKEVQIEKGQKLLVAMSGGVDSSVLFDALSVLSFKMKFIIYVLHFNHKLRGLSSERDEKLVNQLSKDYNVQYFNASGNVKQFAERNSLSIEYAARQLRYNFFEKVARTMNANFVATAHTADDNVETFFLNLFRGSGLTGLSGIPAKRNLVKNVMMIRPLITFRKKELLEYAKIRRLKWFEDESNSLLNYTRNKIRLSLIPRLEEEFNPSINDIINQTAKLMSGADRLIRDIVKKNYPMVVEDASQEKFTIKLPMLMANEEFIQGEIIQYLWLKYFRLQPLPMQTINRILNLHNSQSGAICEINSMYFVLKDRNTLIFTKRQYEENIKLLVSIPGKYFVGRYKIEFTEVDRSEVEFEDNPNIEYFDSSIMSSFLEIRNWQMGDTFQPLGMKGDMKVSDFLINEKVPITEKASVIVLTNKTDIIWIVGKRISDKFKIKKNAEKVIKAVIVKNEKK